MLIYLYVYEVCFYNALHLFVVFSTVQACTIDIHLCVHVYWNGHTTCVHAPVYRCQLYT